jgi:hypothetical protein
VRHFRRGHGLYRIDDKVHDNLLQLRAIDHHLRQIGRQIERIRHVPRLEFVMQQSRAFRDDVSERGLRPPGRPLACHGANTVDDVSRPSRIINDTLQDVLNLLEIGFRPVQPAQCSLTACQDGRKGLVYLVRDRCCQCTKADDPAYMRQLRSNLCHAHLPQAGGA